MARTPARTPRAPPATPIFPAPLCVVVVDEPDPDPGVDVDPPAAGVVPPPPAAAVVVVGGGAAAVVVVGAPAAEVVGAAPVAVDVTPVGAPVQVVPTAMVKVPIRGCGQLWARNKEEVTTTGMTGGSGHRACRKVLDSRSCHSAAIERQADTNGRWPRGGDEG